jgi:hypothetical protein
LLDDWWELCIPPLLEAYKYKVTAKLVCANRTYFRLMINVEKSPGEKPVSILIGQINDQSALSGLLNALYNFNMTILSVNMLKSN